jgi:hypothetical protein
MNAEAAVVWAGQFHQGLPGGVVTLGQLDSAHFSSANPGLSEVRGAQIVAALERGLDPISKEDVEAGIACLQRRHPQLVALSPHDSCAWSIEAFRQAFGRGYQDVRVGEGIVVQ